MDEREYKLDRSFFDEAPPEELGPVGLAIKRAPTLGADIWTILSETLLGCGTHYYRRRTQPCVGTDCPICQEGQSRRWYGWLVGYDPGRREKVLVEVPPGVALALRAYRGNVGSLRGHVIRLSRKNKKENGAVRGEFAAGKFAPELLPACPDIIPLLARMWQIRDFAGVEEMGQALQIHTTELLDRISGEQAG